MEMKFIALTARNGSVQIMQLVQRPDGSYPSVDGELAKWPAVKRDDIARADEIAADAVPSDRTFRDAWTLGANQTIGHDMPKARNIQRRRMREARAPLLAALDVEYQRADESGDTIRKAAVVARKQALRDVTADPAIEAATTPDDLRAVWPAALVATW
jgi:hypothetical protein